MADQAERIETIAKAVEQEAQTLLQKGNFAASTALFELMEADGDTLLRFADIVIQSDAEAGLIP